jgi:hypothetical protein
MDPDALLLWLVLAGTPWRPSVPAPVVARTWGQAAPAPRAAPETEPAGVSVALEARRDRFDCRFENPSSFNTADVVPHFFVQQHDVDNVWLVARIRFNTAGRLWETEVGVTPPGVGLGSDYDTFFQPDGNVIVYGTTAETTLRSWRVAQYVGLGNWRGTRLRAGYSYRNDRSEYRPSYSTTTQTKPPSTSSVWNTDRETTVAEVHEVRLGAARALVHDHRWRAEATADVAPTTLARLSTILPDKYEEPVVFIAKGFSVEAQLRVAARAGRVGAGASIDYVHTWSYGEKNQFHRSGLGASLYLGLIWD